MSKVCMESKERRNWWKQVSQAHGVATKGTKSTSECMHGDKMMLGVVTRDRWIKKVIHSWAHENKRTPLPEKTVTPK